MVGVVGALQFEVLAARIAGRIWPASDFRDQSIRSLPLGERGYPNELEKFVRAYPSSMADDLDGAPVFLAQSAFSLRYDQERWPAIRLTTSRIIR